MRRGDLLQLTGLTTSVFDALGNRAVLPFKGTGKAAGWGNYSVDDAFRLALFLELTRIGKSQIQAAQLVREQFDELLAKAAQYGERSMLFGAFWTRIDVDGEPSSVSPWPLVAELGQVDHAIAETLAKIDERNGHVCEIAAINATEVMRRLYVRAVETELSDARFDDLANVMRASRRYN